ncbi:heterokaryon incompatibility protein-domain-containing protein [Melanogaster broomeanus]|nr:heterokaryon incompatibility protein-domain-containing protein [Melanogaster broomeanus]
MSDVVRAFQDRVFNYMPTHLIYIPEERLIHREDLYRIFQPEGITEEIISLFLTENCSREEAIRNLVSQKLKYAILSHRWFDEGEPSFQMVLSKDGLDGLPGYEKLREFFTKAEESGCSLAWADTCCIDKTSSAELEEAIRTMFRWYRNSEICIVHLAQSAQPTDFQKDEWFTRGWTLQELLAPTRIKIYGTNWLPLTGRDCTNDKENEEIMRAISKVTGIPCSDLRYFSPGLLDVREKMVWASQRHTKRIEDIAYCLLGIFNVSMSIAYGEGRRSFRRLMEAIVQDCREWQIFAWAGPHSSYTAAFPDSPSGYTLLCKETSSALSTRLHSAHHAWHIGHPFYTMTKKGLEIEVLLVEMMMHIDREPLKETNYECITLSPGSENEMYFENIQVLCDIRFMLHSRWAIGIINYQTDGTGNRGGVGELAADTDYVCFFLGTGIYSPYGKWEKVDTKAVVTIRTKQVVWKPVTALWL